MKIIKEIGRITTLTAMGIFLVVGVVSAQTWSAAPSNPPANNAAKPINVSNVSQNKTGNFVANVIGANGFCIGSDCISKWPSKIQESDHIKIVNKKNVKDITTVNCPSGYKVTGGGYERTNDIGGSDERAWLDYPSSDTSWTVHMVHAWYNIYAICIKVE